MTGIGRWTHSYSPSPSPSPRPKGLRRILHPDIEPARATGPPRAEEFRRNPTSPDSAKPSDSGRAASDANQIVRSPATRSLPPSAGPSPFPCRRMDPRRQLPLRHTWKCSRRCADLQAPKFVRTRGVLIIGFIMEPSGDRAVGRGCFCGLPGDAPTTAQMSRFDRAVSTHRSDLPRRIAGHLDGCSVSTGSCTKARSPCYFHRLRYPA
jgi:hypothetical protein